MSAKLPRTNTDLVLFHKEKKKKKSRVGAFLIQEVFFDEVIVAHLAVLSEKNIRRLWLSMSSVLFCFSPPPF